jgi:hypothetical protein
MLEVTRLVESGQQVQPAMCDAVWTSAAGATSACCPQRAASARAGVAPRASSQRRVGSSRRERSSHDKTKNSHLRKRASMRACERRGTRVQAAQATRTAVRPARVAGSAT